jgi:prepilin-type processing-associated H-X9-DG protein
MERSPSESTSETSWFRRSPYSLRGRLLFAAVAALTLGLTALVLLESINSDPGKRATCQSNLMNINFGILNYMSVHGHVPPAYIADKNGKPMHSWRVLILPYLDCQGLYDRYDFTEPWDGPHNRLLAKEMPKFYQCPTYRGGNPYATNYVAVVGPETAWPGEKTVREQDISEGDGTTNTLLVVELADSDICWMEPRDMRFQDAIAGINVDRKGGISSNHGGGAGCAFADGHITFIHSGTPPEVIRALLTINGHEPLERGDYGHSYLKVQPH